MRHSFSKIMCIYIYSTEYSIITCCSEFSMKYLTLSLIRQFCSRRLFENIVTKEEIAQNVFHFQSQVFHSVIEIFYFLTKYVQSRLLQNRRMRKRVKVCVIGLVQSVCYVSRSLIIKGLVHHDKFLISIMNMRVNDATGAYTRWQSHKKVTYLLTFVLMFIRQYAFKSDQN